MKEELKTVYVVTCYGKVLGVYVDSHDAFHVQMTSVNKGRFADLVPCPVTYPLKSK